MKTLVVALILVGGIATVSHAQDDGYDAPDASDFGTLDQDASGGVSFDELSAKYQQLTQADFDAADADNDDDLLAEELENLRTALTD